MNLKIRLDDDLHASLIAKIRARAGGKSVHKAALALMLEWSYFEERSKMGPKWDQNGTNLGQNGEVEEINLSGLDSLDLTF